MIEQIQKHKLGFYQIKNKPTVEELQDYYANKYHQDGFNVCNLIGDFPIDWYLFHRESNYIINKSAAKSAHHAKIEIDCLLAKQNMDDVLNLWRSLGQFGMGRQLTIFLTK